MSLLNGSASCTRLSVVGPMDEPQFDEQAFQTLRPGSAIKERAGFLPMETGDEYKMGEGQYAFRLRIDRIRPNSIMVKERWFQLLKVEEEEVGPPSPKVKRDLRKLAEEEISSTTSPTTQIIQCYMENGTIYAGTTTNSHLDALASLLKKIGVSVAYKTPWDDWGQEADPHHIKPRNPGESVLGCQFLRKLIGQNDVYVEPVKGKVRVVTTEGTRASLSGTVLGELNRYLDEGSEMLLAKLIINEIPLTFHALGFQIGGMKVDSCTGDHWIEVLAERMDSIRAMWDLLDAKYKDLMVQEYPA